MLASLALRFAQIAISKYGHFIKTIVTIRKFNLIVYDADMPIVQIFE